jgi:hypothetical protein
LAQRKERSVSSIGSGQLHAWPATTPSDADPHWARHEHPDWCDPRLCGSRHDLAIHHSEPIRTTAPAACAEIDIGMVRVDVDVPGPVVRGETQVRVHAYDGKGERNGTDVWLDADSARRLAKALDAVADQVDRERRLDG